MKNRFFKHEFCDFAVSDFDFANAKPSQNIDKGKEDFADAKS